MSEPVKPVMCPFTVVIDTREQSPWSFTGFTANADMKHAPLAVVTTTATLATGDYSIAGFESAITIERKSLSDAFGTFTHDRERWERELERMRRIPHCHVVIEAGWDEISAGVVRTGGANIGKAVMRSIFAWSVRYPHVHWWAMPSREMAEATAFRLLEKFWEEDQWQQKELKKLNADSSSSSRTAKTSKGKSSRKVMSSKSSL